MAKQTRAASKKAAAAPTKAPKPITDFFARVPAASQQSTTVLSDTASTRTRSKFAALAACSASETTPAIERPNVAALQSSTASNSRLDKPTLRAPSSPKKAVGSKQTRTASLKRSRSPDAGKALTTPRKPVESKPVPSSQPVRTSPRKKARLSSPGSISQLSDLSVVPSSQSDEEELSMPSTSTVGAKDSSVRSWRKQTLPLTPNSGDNVSEPMDVDEYHQASTSSAPTTPCNDENTTGSFNSTSSMLTPPYTDRSSDQDDLPPVPPTPVALDPAAKTRKMIEDIKARAMATALESRNKMERDIPDEEASDSDSDDMPMLFARKASISPSPSTFAAAPQLRRSTRQRPSLGASSTSSPISRRSRGSVSPPVASSSSKPAATAKGRSKRAPNPIDVLLKEKARAEKKGAGADALLMAESMLKGKSPAGKSAMYDEMDEDMDDVDYDSLKKGIAPLSFGVAVSKLKSSGPVFLDEDVRKELFESGEKSEEDGGGYDGRDINNILREDQEAMEEEAREAERKREGVVFWSAKAETDGMTVDGERALPSFVDAGNSSVLQALSKAMQAQDLTRATWVLKSGALDALPAADDTNIIGDLCILATTCELNSSPLSGAAFNTALKMLNHTAKNPMKCPVSSAFVIKSILELGANIESLPKAGVQIEQETAPWAHVTAHMRDAVLYRVVTLISRAAAAKRLISSEIPDLVITLVSVAMDPSTSHDLRRDISLALNSISLSISPSLNEVNREAEATVASRLVGLAQAQGYEQAVNKAALVSLVASGTGATLRIARFVAYSIIAGYPASSITGKSYCDPPPLPPLMNQLLQPTNEKKKTIFAVTDDTDYVEMKFYTSILAVATSNVRAWVEVERAEAKKKVFGASVSFLKEVVKTDLELLHTLLEELHACINDLRAAHLDRSRTKAAVKQLQMRIYYQRLASDRAWKAAKAPQATMRNWLAGKAGPSSSEATTS